MYIYICIRERDRAQRSEWHKALKLESEGSGSNPTRYWARLRDPTSLRGSR